MVSLPYSAASQGWHEPLIKCLWLRTSHQATAGWGSHASKGCGWNLRESCVVIRLESERDHYLARLWLVSDSFAEKLPAFTHSRWGPKGSRLRKAEVKNAAQKSWAVTLTLTEDPHRSFSMRNVMARADKPRFTLLSRWRLALESLHIEQALQNIENCKGNLQSTECFWQTLPNITCESI